MKPTFAILVVILAGFLGLLGPCDAALAQDMDPMAFPGNRYSRENIDSDVLAHWPGMVSIQFLRLDQASLQLNALKVLLSLANAAGADAHIVGFPNEMFTADRPLAEETNFAVLGYTSTELPLLKSGEFALSDDRFSAPVAAGPIKEILQEGLIEQRPGCLGRWKTTQDNEIEGFVMAISRDLSDEDKILCLWALAPAGFGVFPGVSMYVPLDAATTADSDKNEYFYDKSELTLALSAAAMCRGKYQIFGPECLYKLILKIFSHHGEISAALEHKN